MLEIELHQDADDELKAAAVFYELRLTGLGESFLARVSEGFDLIRNNPLAGQLLFDDFHRILTRQFPYSLVYRVEAERVYVIAIAHWSRRPGYWKGRS
jgi:plasmid stabilization system protein ParE